MKSLYTLVGMKHRGTEALVAGLPKGETLTLIREPTNAHDPNAVQVWARGEHVGYIKGTQAVGMARWLDRVCLSQIAGVLAVTAERWPCVEVDTSDPRAPVEKKADAVPAPEVIIKEGRDV